MGLSWQQGPLALGAVGHFLTDQPLPDRLLFAEPARRRMRIRFDDSWVADSEQVILLHEPGHYPVACPPIKHLERGVLVPTDRTTSVSPLPRYCSRTRAARRPLASRSGRSLAGRDSDR